MSDENPPQPILNPNVYLNYLQPTDANVYEAERDVFLVTFGALLWDILSSLPNDWILIRTTKPFPVLFAYFSSRICALAVVIMSMLMTTGPVPNCGDMQLIICIFWVFASASSSYLFLKRVHAVFLEERLVCHVFTLFWIAAVGATTVLIPATLHGYHQIANTEHCINGEINSYVAAAFFVPVAFDVFVFTAITYKIQRSHRRTTGSTKFWGRCSTKTLPRFSRAILQGGQQYYLITIGFNMTRADIALSSTSSPALQLLPLVPAIAVTSAMSCRVFRNLKLETLQKTEIGNLTTIRFGRINVHLPGNAGATIIGEADLGEC